MEVGDRVREGLEDLADVADGQLLLVQDEKEIPLRLGLLSVGAAVREGNGWGAIFGVWCVSYPP